MKECKICGKIVTKDGDFCSKKCEKEDEKIRKRIKKVAGEKKLKDPLAQKNAEARAAGMTYGQYVAKEKCDEERRRKEKERGKSR